MHPRTVLILGAIGSGLVLVACSSSEDATAASDDSAIDLGTDASTEATVDAPEDVVSETTEDTRDTAVDDTTGPMDAMDASDDGADVADSQAPADTAPKPCKSGTLETASCGKCGTHSRICSKSAWLDWGLCEGETGLCTPTETRTVTCGRCGTRKQTCTSTCEWSSETCVGEKGCFAGTVETSYGTCLDSTKVKTRTCSDSCEWGAWSECT